MTCTAYRPGVAAIDSVRRVVPVGAFFVFAVALCLGPIGAEADELTAVWANNGQDKVARGELRGTADSLAVRNSVWDGTSIFVFGARNEVVAFNLILEAGAGPAAGVSVEFALLTGPGGATISSSPATGDGVFDWTNRPIELFLVRYLQIEGLSVLAYENYYDERHVPERLRRPWSGEGSAVPGSTWYDRPDHDACYPDIAVPLELQGDFDIAAGESQSIWVDIAIPKTAVKGLYSGTLVVRQSGLVTHQVPVQLAVRDFELPDQPTLKTMLYLGYEDINKRYVGESWPSCGTPEAATARLVRDRHFMMAHRHRVTVIDGNNSACAGAADQPVAEWLPRLDGSLFSASFGYAGPGTGTGNALFSIGTYGGWDWQGEGESGMRTHTDAWESWFQANSPSTERFLYLIDESDGTVQIEQWAGWIESNPGVGSDLLSMATIPVLTAVAQTPSLDVAASVATFGKTLETQAAVDSLLADSDNRFWIYNGNRPASGTFATEDDGVALRALGWIQFKKGIQRWFYWESTYYNNFQGGTGETNVFQQAQTFGGHTGFNAVAGETGWNFMNGDGVLFYPGTDTVFPQESYGVQGPFASLRLKLWRRGIQDGEYLNMAVSADPSGVTDLVNQVVPEALWELGVEDPDDPTWVLSDISWSTDPDDWEAARCVLAEIIDPDGGPCEAAIFDDGFESGDMLMWSASVPAATRSSR